MCLCLCVPVKMLTVEFSLRADRIEKLDAGKTTTVSGSAMRVRLLILVAFEDNDESWLNDFDI